VDRKAASIPLPVRGGRIQVWKASAQPVRVQDPREPAWMGRTLARFGLEKPAESSAAGGLAARQQTSKWAKPSTIGHLQLKYNILDTPPAVPSHPWGLLAGQNNFPSAKTVFTPQKRPALQPASHPIPHAKVRSRGRSRITLLGYVIIGRNDLQHFVGDNGRLMGPAMY
jgi:hypothetical protein